MLAEMRRHKIINAMHHEAVLGTYVGRNGEVHRWADSLFEPTFTIAEIADLAGCSVSTVRPIIKRMVELGVLYKIMSSARGQKTKYSLLKLT